MLLVENDSPRDSKKVRLYYYVMSFRRMRPSSRRQRRPASSIRIERPDLDAVVLLMYLLCLLALANAEPGSHEDVLELLISPDLLVVLTSMSVVLRANLVLDYEVRFLVERPHRCLPSPFQALRGPLQELYELIVLQVPDAVPADDAVPLRVPREVLHRAHPQLAYLRLVLELRFGVHYGLVALVEQVYLMEPAQQDLLRDQAFSTGHFECLAPLHRGEAVEEDPQLVQQFGVRLRERLLVLRGLVDPNTLELTPTLSVGFLLPVLPDLLLPGLLRQQLQLARLAIFLL